MDSGASIFARLSRTMAGMYAGRRALPAFIGTCLVAGLRYTTWGLLPSICIAGPTMRLFLEGFAAGAVMALGVGWFYLGDYIAKVRRDAVKALERFRGL
jgi:hypothetical protein